MIVMFIIEYIVLHLLILDIYIVHLMEHLSMLVQYVVRNLQNILLIYLYFIKFAFSPAHVAFPHSEQLVFRHIVLELEDKESEQSMILRK